MKTIRKNVRYSQNKEQDVILNYFHLNKMGGFRLGTFIEIGCNDMITLSNTRALAELGWKGVGVEPSKEAFMKALKNCESVDVVLYNVAIGTENGTMNFWESGSHLKNGDTSLLSTLIESEIDRWKGTEEFTKTQVTVMNWAYFYENHGLREYDFISIDTEGMDVEILKQMDLVAMSVRLICIEWNRVEKVKKEIENILLPLKFKMIAQNGENLIFGL